MGRLTINRPKAVELARGALMSDLNRKLKAELPGIKAAYNKGGHYYGSSSVSDAIKVRVGLAGAGVLGEIGIFNRDIMPYRNADEGNKGPTGWARPTKAGLLMIMENGHGLIVPQNYVAWKRGEGYTKYLMIYQKGEPKRIHFGTRPAQPGKHAIREALRRVMATYGGVGVITGLNKSV